MEPTKEVVEFNDPAGGPEPHPGPMRQIVVTAYRTQQSIRAAVFDVPADFAHADVSAYLGRTFDYLGLYEIFDQEERFCIRDDFDDVEGDDEPELGYEWQEFTAVRL